ncbi:hypothetical protein ACIG87_06595 [Micromonospora sp. NPDC051925]|uniref:hypothetical protein n=1 Tax=Micromonospora sp. NPDC051925 TaxID=3364288 RepID=UPI0037CBD3AB
MNFRRSARSGPTVDRAEAERLLDPTGTGTPPSTDDPLARLLAAAAGPARPDELAGEQEAVAAFRAARAAAVPGPVVAGRRRRRRLTTGVVAWIAGLAATATAGVAFAAVTLDDRPAERVPDPVPSDTHPTPHRSGPDRQSPSRRPPVAPGGAPSAPVAPYATPHHGEPAGRGKLVGQCRAYLAKSPQQRGKAVTKPGFVDLMAAAGGADRVEAYCRDLVPGHPSTEPDDADDDGGGPKGDVGGPKGSEGGGPGRKN